MVDLGKQRGRMVLSYIGEPDAPSRACRWFGHSFDVSTTRRGPRIESVYKFCNRCGATESWYPVGNESADRALASRRAEP